ncbi:MAG: hypothetical protein ABIQ31_10845 [Ferruginibacter sp.]
MKKLILAVAMMIGIISFSTAQKVVDSAAKKHVSKKAMPAKSSVSTVAPAKPAPGVVLKKDGTPDKRYNSAAAKAKGPLKKDSTPDLRYKANKKP